MRPPKALILGLGLAAACGGGSGGDGLTGTGGNNNNSGQPATSATINMRTVQDGYGYEGASTFDPGSRTIVRGGTITWSNSSGTTHNVTFDSNGSPSNVPDLTSGTASRTFGTTGTFYFHCSNHSGMTGSISVQ